MLSADHFCNQIDKKKTASVNLLSSPISIDKRN